MGYLIIKDLDVSNILIKTTYNSYKLLYKTNHSILSGITLRIYNIDIEDKLDHFCINIYDKGSIDILKKIDDYLSIKLGVKHIIKNNSLSFKKNDIVNKKIKQYSDTIDIYIFMVKKTAYQTSPIVYML